MSLLISYNVSVRIFINHTYFNKDKNFAYFVPTVETKSLLNKMNIILRKVGKNSWVLLKQDNLIDEELCLKFEIKPNNLNFYFYTEKSEINDCECKLDYIGRHGVYDQLSIPCSMLIGLNKDINIDYFNKKKQFEFILIPKYSKGSINPKLIEDKNKLDFSDIEIVNIPSEINAFRAFTKNAIDLKNTYEYSIRLWDEKEGSSYLVINDIPIPEPDSISVIDQTMITSYIYF